MSASAFPSSADKSHPPAHAHPLPAGHFADSPVCSHTLIWFAGSIPILTEFWLSGRPNIRIGLSNLLIVDLYQLFGQLAGIDVHKSVPRTVDSASTLPYLVHPSQSSIRKSNFTEIGTNLHAGGEINGPCQYNTTTCTQIAPTQSVCKDNNGIWWGVGATDPSTAGSAGLKLCCDVAIYQANHSETVSTDIYPLEAFAVRNNLYKLVINDYHADNATPNSCVATSTKEFYQINENVPLPKLDTANADLLANGVKLNPAQQKHYDSLNAQFKTLLASQPACPARLTSTAPSITSMSPPGRCSRRFRRLQAGPISTWTA